MKIKHCISFKYIFRTEKRSTIYYITSIFVLEVSGCTYQGHVLISVKEIYQTKDISTIKTLMNLLSVFSRQHWGGARANTNANVLFRYVYKYNVQYHICGSEIFQYIMETKCPFHKGMNICGVWGQQKKRDIFLANIAKISSTNKPTNSAQGKLYV